MDAMQKRKRITYLFEEINGKIKNKSKKNSQENNRNFSNPITKSRIKKYPYMGVATMALGAIIFLVSGAANSIN